MSRYRMWIGCALLAGVFLLPAGCLLFPGDAETVINVGDGLRGEVVVSDAQAPSAFAFAADGKIFYAERKTGHIRLIEDGVLLETPFASVPVNYAGERGLLGLAVHPQFNLNGRVYAFYSRSDTDISTANPDAIVDHRVVYFEAPVDIDGVGSLATGGEVFVASLPAGSGTTRIGGQLTFLPDGTLLVAMGDLGDDGNVQGAEILVGKVLRYRDDGSVPGDNPDPNSPVFATGFRAPRGLDVDPVTGDAWMTERTRDGVHELNVIFSGGNYGWPTVTGTADTAAEDDFVADHPTYVDPIAVRAASDGAVAGAAFNPETKYGTGELLRFFFGLVERGEVVSLSPRADRYGSSGSRVFANRFNTPINAVGFTTAGTLYVASENAITRVRPLTLFPAQ